MLHYILTLTPQGSFPTQHQGRLRTPGFWVSRGKVGTGERKRHLEVSLNTWRLGASWRKPFTRWAHLGTDFLGKTLSTSCTYQGVGLYRIHVQYSGGCGALDAVGPWLSTVLSPGPAPILDSGTSQVPCGCHCGSPCLLVHLILMESRTPTWKWLPFVAPASVPCSGSICIFIS